MERYQRMRRGETVRSSRRPRQLYSFYEEIFHFSVIYRGLVDTFLLVCVDNFVLSCDDICGV